MSLYEQSSRFIDIGETKVHYHDLGAADAPVLMMIHGSGLGASGW